MSTDNKMDDRTKPAWHNLAEQATHEDDGEKLCRLVEEICDTIDAAQAAKKKPTLPAIAEAVQPDARQAILHDAAKKT